MLKEVISCTRRSIMQKNQFLKLGASRPIQVEQQDHSGHPAGGGFLRQVPRFKWVCDPSHVTPWSDANSSHDVY